MAQAQAPKLMKIQIEFPIFIADISKRVQHYVQQRKLSHQDLPSRDEFLHHSIGLLHNSTSHEGEQCSICQEKMDSHIEDHAPVETIACKHVFGIGCLRQWLKTNKNKKGTCPLCRTTLCRVYDHSDTFQQWRFPRVTPRDSAGLSETRIAQYRNALWRKLIPILENHQYRLIPSLFDTIKKNVAGVSKANSDEARGSLVKRCLEAYFLHRIQYDRGFGWMIDSPEAEIFAEYYNLLSENSAYNTELVRPLLSLGNLLLDLSYQGLTHHMADNFCLNIIRFASDFDFSAGLCWDIFEKARKVQTDQDLIPLRWLLHIVREHRLHHDFDTKDAVDLELLLNIGKYWAGTPSPELCRQVAHICGKEPQLQDLKKYYHFDIKERPFKAKWKIALDAIQDSVKAAPPPKRTILLVDGEEEVRKSKRLFQGRKK